MILRREPVAVANAVAALIEAGIIVAVTFGADITPEQTAAIGAFVVVAGQTVATLVGRSKVTPLNEPRDGEGRYLTPNSPAKAVGPV